MRILLADGQSKVRFALRALLEEQSGCRIAGEATHSQDLLALVETTCPDLLLLSWELPGLPGAALVPLLREVCPGLYVIALSGRRPAQQAALAAGVDAFVSKAAPPERVLGAIRTAGELRASGRTGS